MKERNLVWAVLLAVLAFALFIGFRVERIETVVCHLSPDATQAAIAAGIACLK